MVFRYTTEPFLVPFGLTDRQMDAFFSEFDRVPCKSTQAQKTVQPNYLLRTNESGTSVDVELPGVAQENVEVEVKEGVLTVIGKRYDRSQAVEAGTNADKAPVQKASDETRDASEIEKDAVEQTPSVVYMLKARLSRDSDVDGIEARSVGNGMLHLNIPAKKHEVRRIEIMCATAHHVLFSGAS